MERGEILKALLDTSALIDILKGDKNAIAKIENLKNETVFYTTTINIYEILRGINLLPKGKERHRQAMELLVANLNVLPIDVGCCEMAALVYAELRKKGLEIDEPDYLIAGAALSNEIKLIITRNEKHFNQIKGLQVLAY